MFRAVLVVGCVVSLNAASAADPAAGKPVASAGVVAPSGKVIYLPAKAGGVEAVSVETGKALWVAASADRVAGATDKFVVGWTPVDGKPSQFRVAVLDAASGELLTSTKPIDTAEWASVTRVPGRSFRVGAKFEGASAVVVWEARAFYAGGAPPPPEVEKAARKSAAGTVTIDPAAGKYDAAPLAAAKDADFAGSPDSGGEPTFGEFTFSVEERLPANEAPGITRRTLKVSRGGRLFWTREIAGNPWSPPRP